MTDKNLDTLVEDILNLTDPTKSAEINTDDVVELAEGIAFQVIKQTQEHVKLRDPKTLYASEVGEPCMRKLWYKVHYPEKGENLTRETKIKFMYGDILEEVLLFMAKVAGHDVQKRQASVVHEFEDGWQIRGRIDAVIDDRIVDVKTASPYSYTKMVEQGLTKENDAFGYTGQIGFYNVHKDQLDVVDDDPMFLVMDKQNGKVGLASPAKDVTVTLKTLEEVKDAVKDPVVAPDRGFSDVPTTNGNKKLGINCSYCAFKGTCWPGLRVFSYARGPEFLTQVRKAPKNSEITEYWKRTAYNLED